MNHSCTIVGIETFIGSARGLNQFDQNIYDGISIKDQKSDLTHQDILEKVIHGAIKKAKTQKQNLKLSEIGVILISETEDAFHTVDCKFFRKEVNFVNCLKEALQILSQSEEESLLIVVLEKSFDSWFAAAILLKSYKASKQDEYHIYAVIDDIDSYQSTNYLYDDSKFEDIDYLEINGLPLESFLKNPLANISNTKRNDHLLPSCALGSSEKIFPVKSKNMMLMLSIIKLALCLYHRYIPGNPHWKTPSDLQLWEKTPFYIPTHSRTWFVNKTSKRKALIFFYDKDKIVRISSTEDETLPYRAGKYLAQGTPFCFPVPGNNEQDLVENVNVLISLMENEKNLQKLAFQNFQNYTSKPDTPYALVLIAQTAEDLQKEIQFMLKGIKLAFNQNKEFKTPKGSYFTSNPLGIKGKLVFVYPGVGSAYLGLGQDLFHMFPAVYDQFSLIVSDMEKILKATELYPRRLDVPDENELKRLERQMRKDVMDISECGISFSVIYTMILAGYFKLIPELAMGYSMGETSMMASLMVWVNPGQLSGKLAATDVFSKGLHGELTAVRKDWGLPEYQKGDDTFIWESYTLLADKHQVQEVIKDEDRVYLTLINTDTEVVIAGDPNACIKVAKKLGCEYFPLRLDLAIHSKPAWLEYDNIVNLFTLPTEKPSGIKFYSSSCYMPVPIRTKAIANSIARAFCDPVDFPRLVRKVYDDGGRIFIEAGPRNICSKWINNILENQEAITVPFNIKGTRDQMSIVKALAQLVSHRVSVDISGLIARSDDDELRYQSGK